MIRTCWILQQQSIFNIYGEGFSLQSSELLSQQVIYCTSAINVVTHGMSLKDNRGVFHVEAFGNNFVVDCSSVRNKWHSMLSDVVCGGWTWHIELQTVLLSGIAPLSLPGYRSSPSNHFSCIPTLSWLDSVLFSMVHYLCYLTLAETLLHVSGYLKWHWSFQKLSAQQRKPGEMLERFR